MEYKVGDWVVVLDTPGLKDWTRGEEAIGYCFQLGVEAIACIETGHTFLCPTNKYSINYDIGFIRKALPKEIPGYKKEKYVELKRILKQLKIK